MISEEDSNELDASQNNEGVSNLRRNDEEVYLPFQRRTLYKEQADETMNKTLVESNTSDAGKLPMNSKEKITARLRKESKINIGNHTKNKLLTDYTLAMLNFIPATIVQQLISDENLDNITNGDSESPAKPSEGQSQGVRTSSSQKTLKQTNHELPLCYRSQSIVLVAEIINFYDQEQAAEFSDCNGFNEYMATISSQFLEVASSVLNKYGGDLIQFLGYSIVAIWPPDPNEQNLRKKSNGIGEHSEFQDNESYSDYAQEVSRKAIQCAFEMRQEFEALKDPKMTKMKLVVGMGFDDIQVLHMGGVLKRVEFFVCGKALQKALGALKATRTVTQKQQTNQFTIAVSSEIWKQIKDISGGTQDTADHTVQDKKRPSGVNRISTAQTANEGYWFVTKTDANVKLIRNVYLMKHQIDALKIQKVQIQLKSYIPGAFRHLAHSKASEKSEQQNQFGQHLKQTVLAMAIDLSQNTLQCSSKEQLTLIQTIIEIIQTQVYRMEGAVTKVMAYESGLIVAASWGSAFLSHFDDPPRAIFAALNIKRHLRGFKFDHSNDDSFFEPPVHIGIATGDIYQGVVGNYTRKEVVSIGEAFERALLLMHTAARHYGKFYLDFTTKQMSCQYIDSSFVEHLEFSHKIINEAIFQPTSELKETEDNVVDAEFEGATMHQLLDSKSKAKFQASRIRIHSNPFFVDINNSYQRNFCDAYGRSDIISQIVDDISDYVGDKDSDHVWVLAVRGNLGSGKSLFARKLLLETNYRQKHILRPHIAKNHEFVFEYICCSANINQSQKFVGIWRPFLRHLLEVYANYHKQSKEYTINSQVLNNNVDDKVQTIEEIFGLKHLSRGKSQRHNSQAALHLAKSSIAQSKSQTTVGNQKKAVSQGSALLLGDGQRFDADYEDSIILFCLDFIVHALHKLKSQCCFFVVLDNVSTMNLSSWKLFDLVTSQANFLVLVMNIQTRTSFFANQEQETNVSDFEFKILPDEECLSYYRTNLKPREADLFNIADMGPLQKKFFKEALLDLSKVYERDINIEIEHMTKILDASNTVKTFTDQKKLKDQLITHYSAYQHFNSIDDEIMDVIMNKSSGNPLTAFWFAYQAIIGHFVQIKGNKLITSTKFRNSVAMNNWTNLQLPYFLFKKNQIRIQKAVNQTKGIAQLDNSGVIQMMQILMIASVIGDVFSSKLLDSISKDFNTSDKLYPTNSLLKELEDRDLIELIYNDNSTSELFYRFNHPFTRVTLYQMQPFEWKVRQIHQKVIQFMKDNTMLDYTTGWSLEKEYLILMRHIMSAEQIYVEEKLDRKSTQVLIIKKVNQRLIRNAKSILSGNLSFSTTNSKEKQKTTERIQAFQQKSEEVFVALKHKRLEWFQEGDNDDQGVVFQSNLTSTKYRLLGFVDLDQINKVKEVGIKGLIEGNLSKAKRGQSKMIRDELKDQGDGQINNGVRTFKLKCNKWFRFDKRQRQFLIQGSANLVFTQQEVALLPSEANKGPQTQEWVTAIDYIKTKKTMDNFVHNYGAVNFPVEGTLGNQASLLQPKKITTVQERSNFSRKYAHNQQTFGQVPIKTPGISQSTTPQNSQSDNNMLAKRSYTVKAMKTIKVNQLARQLQTVFNISYLSFLHHMNKCSIGENEEKNDAVLGQIQTYRDPGSGSDESYEAEPPSKIKEIFEEQIQQILNPDTKRFHRNQTSSCSSLIESDLSEFDSQKEKQTTYSKQKTGVDQMTFKSVDKDKFHSGDPQQLLHELNDSMDLDNQENTMKTMVKEEKRAHVAKKKTKRFLHGYKLAEAKMVPQEKFEGELGQFKLQRRFDKIGYNQVMSPFINQNGIPNSHTLPSQEDSQANFFLAEADHNDVSPCSNNFQLAGGTALGQTLKREKSILSLQAQVKLPERNRVAKGQAIQKILENTQKPWYMLTGREYVRPQLASSSRPELEEHEETKSVAVSDREKIPPQINILEDTKSVKSRSSQTPSDKLSQKSGQKRPKIISTSSEKGHSPMLSGRSTRSKNRMQDMDNLRNQIFLQSRESATKIPQKINEYDSNINHVEAGDQSKDASFSEYVNILQPKKDKEFTGTFGNSPSPSKQADDMQAAALYLNQISNTGMLDSGAENYNSTKLQSEKAPAFKQTNETIIPSMIKDNYMGREAGEQPKRQAVVKNDKTPFIVLSNGGRQQNPEELGLSLNRGDIVTIVEDILTQQTQYGVKLTKCLMETRHGLQLYIVLASHTIEPYSDIQQRQARIIEEIKEARLTSDQMQHAMFNFQRTQPFGASSSQILGMPVIAKEVNQTSADNLLMMNPSQLLDLHPTAIQTGYDFPVHQTYSGEKQTMADQVINSASMKIHQRQTNRLQKPIESVETIQQLYSYKKRKPSGRGLALSKTHTMFSKMEQRKQQKERQERQIAEIEAIQQETRRNQRKPSPQSEMARYDRDLDLNRGRNLQTDQDQKVRTRINFDGQSSLSQKRELTKRMAREHNQMARSGQVPQEMAESAIEKIATPTGSNGSAVPVALKVNERVRKKREIYYQ